MPLRPVVTYSAVCDVCGLHNTYAEESMQTPDGWAWFESERNPFGPLDLHCPSCKEKRELEDHKKMRALRRGRTRTFVGSDIQSGN